jgi:hypothetical protein
MPRAAAAPTMRVMRIEEYAVLGDLETVALVGSDASVDWMTRAPSSSPSTAPSPASTGATDDGRPGGGGQFLACSSWLVSALTRYGRVARRRQVGDFQQAFSHLGRIGAAQAIDRDESFLPRERGSPQVLASAAPTSPDGAR